VSSVFIAGLKDEFSDIHRVLLFDVARILNAKNGKKSRVFLLEKGDC